MSGTCRPGAEEQCPPALPGFKSVQRFWDSHVGRWTARVLPGEFYVTASDEAITTVLGSCIAACIRDPVLGVGGMNHFMLPEDSPASGTPGTNPWLDPSVGLATRYGSHAMESLINALLKLGASRERLEVKLFGAGRMLASITDVGARNIAFVRAYLRTEGLQAAAEDLGDIYPRRVIYFPSSGRALVRRRHPRHATEVAAREQRYRGAIESRSQGGDVELFD